MFNFELMKFSAFILFFLLIFIYNSNSQIYFGIISGLNSANIRFVDDEVNKSFSAIENNRFGYNAGICGDFYFSKVLSVEIDLAYTTKGFNFEQTYSRGYKQFNYIQLNANGKIDFNPDEDIIFSAYVAPYAAYWLSGKRMISGVNYGYVVDKIPLQSDTTFRYNRYDLGLIFGTEMKFEQENDALFIIGLKYEHGMISTDIDKVDGWFNRNISLYFRYLFNLN